jgi:phage terminase small subunit
MALNDRQELFCKQYLIDLNATQAAIRAGYDEPSARQTGSKLLSYADVQDRIQGLMDKRGQKLEITADKVIQELARIGFYDIRDYVSHYNESGLTLRPLEDIDGRVVKSIREKRDKDGNSFIDMDFHDKVSALDKLGKHLKLWTDAAQIRLPIPVTIRSTDGRTIAEFRAEDPNPSP